MDVKINPEWKEVLEQEFEKEYFKKIVAFLHREKREGKVIYPPGPLIFNAFDTTPFSKVKVVILGQDPYHGAGQAHGLSFSVPDGVAAPPSLKNIYKEIEDDLAIKVHKNGSLVSWAKQGVGWNIFTDAVIRAISERKEHVVFMLWGNYARSKKALIDKDKHLILEAAHPSPLARGAFFGCKHFSKCNSYLKEHGETPIDWSI